MVGGLEFICHVSIDWEFICYVSIVYQGVMVVMMDKNEPNMDKHGMIILMETMLKTLDPKHVSCFEGF